MSGPEETNLVEFLTGGSAEAATLPLTLPDNSGLASACVQIEHTKPAFCIERHVADEKPNTAAAPMSAHRLLVCLAVLGWSERELARRTGRLQTTVRRWTSGRSPVPADVAGWIETLAAFHRAHPAPRAGQELPVEAA